MFKLIKNKRFKRIKLFLYTYTIPIIQVQVKYT